MQRNPTSFAFYGASITLAALAIGLAVFAHMQREATPSQPPVFASPLVSVGEVD